MLKRFLTLLLFIVGGVLAGQSPGTVAAFQAPFNKLSTWAANIEYGHNSLNTRKISYYGIRSNIDLLKYRFDMSLGTILLEDQGSNFSFNTILTRNLSNPLYDQIDHYAFFVGFGFAKIPIDAGSDSDMVNIPMGMTIGLDISAPVVDVNISIAPRLQYRIIYLEENVNSLGGGLGIGAILRKTGGKVGLRLGLDYLSIKQNAMDDSQTETTFSIGIEYLLKKGL